MSVSGIKISRASGELSCTMMISAWRIICGHRTANLTWQVPACQQMHHGSHSCFRPCGVGDRSGIGSSTIGSSFPSKHTPRRLIPDMRATRTVYGILVDSYIYLPEDENAICTKSASKAWARCQHCGTKCSATMMAASIVPEDSVLDQLQMTRN